MATLDRAHMLRAVPCNLSQLISADSSTEVIEPFAVFHAVKVPDVTLEMYLERLDKYAQCSSTCFALTAFFIERLLVKYPALQLNSHNVHRLILASFVCSCKLWDDDFHKNTTYAQIGGVPIGELNQLEASFLCLLGFDLAVNENEFANFTSQLLCCTTRELCCCRSFSKEICSPTLSPKRFSCENHQPSQTTQRVQPKQLFPRPSAPTATAQRMLNFQFLDHFTSCVRKDAKIRGCNLSASVREYLDLSTQLNHSLPSHGSEEVRSSPVNSTWAVLNVSFLTQMRSSDTDADWSQAARDYLQYARQMEDFRPEDALQGTATFQVQPDCESEVPFSPTAPIHLRQSRTAVCSSDSEGSACLQSQCNADETNANLMEKCHISTPNSVAFLKNDLWASPSDR